MNTLPDRASRLTYMVELPGGQDRLRQAILYVSAQCQRAERFGHIKLNKIIWKADFDSFASRRIPVTGRRYVRQKFGPVAKDMLPLHRDMLTDGLIRVDEVDLGDDIVEHRTIPLTTANLALFTELDIRFPDLSIRYYWDMSGLETSDDSHGVAWRTRANGDPMPYEAAFLSDALVSTNQLRKLHRLAFKEGWTSD